MDDSNILHTFIDTYYAVPKNMRGQTGSFVSMGYGFLTDNSLKQKLNSKSSTETEAIGMRNMFPHNIWLMIFG